MRDEEVIARTLRRTRGYWYDDGLSELAMGAVFAAIGLLFLVEGTGRIPPGASSLGLMAIVLGGALVSRRLVAWGKARLTYPRTGYVAYTRQRSPRSRLFTGVLGGAMGMLIAVLLVNAPAALAWLPALQGLLGAGVMLYMANFTGLARFYLVAALSALAGLAAALAGLGDMTGGGAYFLALGLALALSGLIALLRYLRQTSGVSES
ncbi:MAG: hypothetical protein ACYC4L_20450 [Chloroflexota bacterium]